MVTFETPGGRELQAEVPEGVKAGEEFEITYAVEESGEAPPDEENSPLEKSEEAPPDEENSPLEKRIAAIEASAVNSKVEASDVNSKVEENTRKIDEMALLVKGNEELIQKVFQSALLQLTDVVHTNVEKMRAELPQYMMTKILQEIKARSPPMAAAAISADIDPSNRPGLALQARRSGSGRPPRHTSARTTSAPSVPRSGGGGGKRRKRKSKKRKSKKRKSKKRTYRRTYRRRR